MRLTRAGEYAVRCILYLASQGDGVVSKRKELAEAIDIPEQFLSKIAQRLVVSPDKLSLLDVVEAVIGEIFLNDCVMRPESCYRSNTCAVNRVWEKARNQLRETLREATFSRLLKEDSCFNPFIESQLQKKQVC